MSFYLAEIKRPFFLRAWFLRTLMLGLDHGPSLLQASPNHASTQYSSHLALKFAAQGSLFQPQIVSRLQYYIFLLLLCEAIECKKISSALLAYIYIHILRSYLFFLFSSLSLSLSHTHKHTHTHTNTHTPNSFSTILYPSPVFDPRYNLTKSP